MWDSTTHSCIIFFVHLNGMIHGLRARDVPGLSDTHSFYIVWLIHSVTQCKIQWFVLTDSQIAALAHLV